MTVDEYIARMDVDFVRRMRNWAAEARGDGHGHVKAMDYGAMPSSGYREASIPVMTGEASDTDRAVATLPLRYRQAVVQFWCYEGRSWVWHGQHRGIADKTFAVWAEKGHAMVRDALAVGGRHRAEMAAVDEWMIRLIRA